MWPLNPTIIIINLLFNLINLLLILPVTLPTPTSTQQPPQPPPQPPPLQPRQAAAANGTCLPVLCRCEGLCADLVSGLSPSSSYVGAVFTCFRSCPSLSLDASWIPPLTPDDPRRQLLHVDRSLVTDLDPSSVSHLRVLLVSGSRFASAATLLALLSARAARLELLAVSGDTSGALGERLLAGILTGFPRLAALALPGCGLGGLADGALEELPSLRSVDLSGNNVSSFSAAWFGGGAAGGGGGRTVTAGGGDAATDAAAAAATTIPTTFTTATSNVDTSATNISVSTATTTPIFTLNTTNDVTTISSTSTTSTTAAASTATPSGASPSAPIVVDLRGNPLRCVCAFRGVRCAPASGPRWRALWDAGRCSPDPFSAFSPLPDCEAPSFLAAYQEVSAPELTDARLTCASRGLPAPVLSWRDPLGAPLAEAAVSRASRGPWTLSTATLRSVRASEGGLYACRAAGAEGAAAAVVLLGVTRSRDAEAAVAWAVGGAFLTALPVGLLLAGLLAARRKRRRIGTVGDVVAAGPGRCCCSRYWKRFGAPATPSGFHRFVDTPSIIGRSRNASCAGDSAGVSARASPGSRPVDFQVGFDNPAYVDAGEPGSAPDRGESVGGVESDPTRGDGAEPGEPERDAGSSAV